MMDHIKDLLGPYLDGELRASQITKVEKHLETCDLCRSELRELRKLSTLLQENKKVTALKPQEQFVAEVGLMMERHPEPGVLQRAMSTGWKAIPVGLAGAWLFLQTSTIITTLFAGLSRIAPDLPWINQLTPSPVPSVLSNTLNSFTHPLIVQVVEFVTERLDAIVPITWQIPILTLLPILIGTLYTCWLASWWAVRESRMNQDTA